MIQKIAAVTLAALTAVITGLTPAHVTTRGGDRGGGGCCTAAQRAPWIVWPLGDSITEGVTPGTADGGYRSRLDTAWTPSHRFTGTITDPQGRRHDGHSGWPAKNVRTSLSAWMADIEAPDVVLYHLGTNDVGRDFNRTAAQVLADTTLIIDAIHARFPNAHVVIALIPQVPINTAAQKAALDGFNAGLPALVAARSWARLVDQRGTHISTDGVHPDAAGYDQEAAVWKGALPTGNKIIIG